MPSPRQPCVIVANTFADFFPVMCIMILAVMRKHYSHIKEPLNKLNV